MCNVPVQCTCMIKLCITSGHADVFSPLAPSLSWSSSSLPLPPLPSLSPEDIPESSLSVSARAALVGEESVGGELGGREESVGGELGGREESVGGELGGRAESVGGEFRERQEEGGWEGRTREGVWVREIGSDRMSERRKEAAETRDTDCGWRVAVFTSCISGDMRYKYVNVHVQGNGIHVIQVFAEGILGVVQRKE